MSRTMEMLEAHPDHSGNTDGHVEDMSRVIDAMTSCANACAQCADACLAERSHYEMLACIRSGLDCADICAAAARVLSRRTESDPDVIRSLLTSCAVACGTCANECERHTEMMHCRICAEECRRCEMACRTLLADW
jgi:hypothetical protein